MKPSHTPVLRGLTVQVFAITVLPLTLLLLIITFTSVFRHQQDMRALVGERDERAIQSAAVALDAELHHRASNISNLIALAEVTNKPTLISTTDDLAADFDGGLAYLTLNGQLITTTGNPKLWEAALEEQSLESSNQPIFSKAFFHPQSKRTMVIVSQYSAPLHMIVAGAFSPENLASQVLSASYTASERATIYLIYSAGHTLYTSASESAKPLDDRHHWRCAWDHLWLDLVPVARRHHLTYSKEIPCPTSHVKYCEPLLFSSSH